ncbi:MAG: hypothetical protein KA780_00080 [Prolixibacteraceae bacterium]|nr:hypothetical protein [Prolixibacteraceae bacterium]
MQGDSISYDSLEARPLPKWLTDQKEGLNTWQPPKMEMKEDHSLSCSLFATGAVLLLLVSFLTVYILHKNKKKKAL